MLDIASTRSSLNHPWHPPLASNLATSGLVGLLAGLWAQSLGIGLIFFLLNFSVRLVIDYTRAKVSGHKAD